MFCWHAATLPPAYVISRLKCATDLRVSPLPADGAKLMSAKVTLAAWPWQKKNQQQIEEKDFSLHILSKRIIGLLTWYMRSFAFQNSCWLHFIAETCACSLPSNYLNNQWKMHSCFYSLLGFNRWMLFAKHFAVDCMIVAVADFLWGPQGEQSSLLISNNTGKHGTVANVEGLEVIAWGLPNPNTLHVV